ncbi:inositol monophosphatase [Pimelobacter simplex]|uniref:Inositol-1-monophosphatase n=1 Tax=Nocardioides simplex TaxID=2045 RepID=A0A0A1DKU5_NOCSI|nr:inositol monophosphatase family protein [Pimelobacter simplex]AIY17277.1 Inositol-1-monophosphatase [Pimelobacter simplex]MCG8151504.1 inositol monophosphatase [Pimelobacter simplex]GEB13310.1 inositol monophosphatase [Pimelobacter simplex]SFM46589.1 myo-inositol-1(or 4)-monophosphatase [Pimelobacter simplex]
MTGPAGLRGLAEDVAGEAAALVREHAGRGVAVAATKSSEVDVVTAADRASEELIRRLILEARPGDGFLGEEGDDVTGTSGVRWIVDPIDGTVNFLYGLPEYAVSVAAEVDGEVVAGVVVDVAKQVVYAGHRGGAATRNGRPIAARGPAPLAHRLVATGFNYTRPVRTVQAAAAARLLPEIRDLRRTGSCALDLCRVAEGALDGYVEEGVHLWDHAAGGLIAQLAGARLLVTVGAAGTEAVVCGPEHGFDELLSAVRTAGFLRE